MYSLFPTQELLITSTCIEAMLRLSCNTYCSRESVVSLYYDSTLLHSWWNGETIWEQLIICDFFPYEGMRKKNDSQSLVTWERHYDNSVVTDDLFPFSLFPRLDAWIHSLKDTQCMDARIHALTDTLCTDAWTHCSTTHRHTILLRRNNELVQLRRVNERLGKELLKLTSPRICKKMTMRGEGEKNPCSSSGNAFVFIQPVHSILGLAVSNPLFPFRISYFPVSSYDTGLLGTLPPPPPGWQSQRVWSEGLLSLSRRNSPPHLNQ